MEDFEEYKQEVVSEVQQTVGSKPVQPIIFAGTGLSIRYFSAPSWDVLLKKMAKKCPKLDHEYGYYRQKHSPAKMGGLLADWYSQWAWDEDYEKFDEWGPSYNEPSDTYLKNEISDYFQNITPSKVSDLNEDDLSGDLTLSDAQNEIEKLRDIQPHAIITTNYDEFLEVIFNQDDDDEFEEDKYKVIVGEQILKAQQNSVGEILKIHGSSSSPESLIVTSEDYEEFNNRKRYLSSKMLTYFAEHPLLIVGYSASDSNVRRILSWMKQVLPEGEVAEDIYFLEYERDIDEREAYEKTKRIQLGGDRFITVKRIVANDFEWVFDAFSSGVGFELDVRTRRKLMANTYDVVRSKTPEAKVVDVNRVEEIAEDTEELATVLGIAVESGKFSFQFDHDYGPEKFYDAIGVGSARAFKTKVLVPIWEREGINITQFNNKYHIAFFDRGAVEYRSYSEAAIDLANDILNDNEWELGIPDEQVPDDDILEGRGLQLDIVL
jgi:hypothetical protein